MDSFAFEIDFIDMEFIKDEELKENLEFKSDICVFSFHNKYNFLCFRYLESYLVMFMFVEKGCWFNNYMLNNFIVKLFSNFIQFRLDLELYYYQNLIFFNWFNFKWIRSYLYIFFKLLMCYNVLNIINLKCFFFFFINLLNSILEIIIFNFLRYILPQLKFICGCSVDITLSEFFVMEQNFNMVYFRDWDLAINFLNFDEINLVLNELENEIF